MHNMDPQSHPVPLLLCLKEVESWEMEEQLLMERLRGQGPGEITGSNLRGENLTPGVTLCRMVSTMGW